MLVMWKKKKNVNRDRRYCEQRRHYKHYLLQVVPKNKNHKVAIFPLAFFAIIPNFVNFVLLPSLPNAYSNETVMRRENRCLDLYS